MRPSEHFRAPSLSLILLVLPLRAFAQVQSPSPEAVRTAPATPADSQDIRGQNRDGGAPGIGVAVHTDEAPLPVPAKSRATESGDVLEAPASGDPFFLGFAAGPHYPPAREQIDPDLLSLIERLGPDGRWHGSTYAFVMFKKRITPQRVAELQTLGARVLGFHPHYCLRVALPPAVLREVAGHPAVRWVGVPKLWQKIDPILLRMIDATGGGPIPVYIDVHESDMNPASTSKTVGSVVTADPGNPRPVEVRSADQLGRIWMSNGWQQRALERLGVKIECYVDECQAFKARVTPAQLLAVLALDFVLCVEPDLPAVTYHDESTPMILSDLLRAGRNGGTNKVALAGILDSGYRYAHEALDHIFAYGVDYTGSAGGALADTCRHGSHVAGTILAEPPAASLGLRGNAPGLGWGATGRFRVVKFFDGAMCAAAATPHATLYSNMRNPFTDAGMNVSPKPHVVNNSWGIPGVNWVGSDASSRTLDAEVYNNDQVYVFAAGNAGNGAGSVGTPGVAKNALTVGNVVDYRDAVVGDPGNIWTSSSRGPAGDGRFKPNLCAPGRWINSVNSAGVNGYMNNSGTSMAAPHVTGVISLLLDDNALAFLRYAPARVASVLMATTMTKNDQAIGTGALGFGAHLNAYGAGRVNAYRANYTTSQFRWINWAFTQTSAGWQYGDFNVNAGTTRLVAVLHYIEPPSGAGAASALVNNVDFYLDPAPIDPAGNTGDYFSHQSAIDNTEIRIIDNPAAGAWRWKSWPQAMTGTAKVSVTIALISGNTRPNGTLVVTASNDCVQPNTNVDITATASNPSYIASAVFFDSTVPAGTTLVASTTTLKDGVVTNLLNNQHGGLDVEVGDILHGETRSAKWTARWATEGVKNWSVNARSDNWVNKTTAVNITVDGTPPVMGPVSINAGAKYTTSLNVNVTASATDPLSGPSEMRYSSNNTTWSAWFPYSAAARPYDLASNGGTSAQGTKTVYVQVRDKCGNVSASRSDTIIYFLGSFTPFGSGCSGSNGQDVQTANGLPETGQTANYLLAGGRSNSAAILVIGFSKTFWRPINLPFAIPPAFAPGCTVYNELATLVTAPTNATGACTIPVRVPNDINLITNHYYTQYWCMDQGANPLGLTFSNAMDTQLGGNL